MKNFIFIIISIILLGSNSFAKINTLDKVDLGKFAGTWYRIAANPILFEPKSACARQVLTPTAGPISVYNSAILQSSGKLFEIGGTADPVDSTGSKLNVDFGGGRKGSYWIIAFDPANGYAAVTDSWGYSLYIMSRTPALAANLYQKAVAEASAQVNTKRLQIEEQTNCSYPPIK